MSELKILCCTMYSDSHKSLAEICVPNMEQFCEKHGYGFAAIPIQNDQYHYKKHLFFSEIIKSAEYDAIFYCDVDSLIMNHNVGIESYLEYEYPFYITEDPNGFNGGALILKCSAAGWWFNEFVLGQRGNFENEQNVYDHFREDETIKKLIKILPHPSINSYDYSAYGEYKERIGREDLGDWKDGNFLIHFPGLSIENKIEMMQEFKEKIIE